MCYSGVDAHGAGDKSASDLLDYCLAFEMASASLVNKGPAARREGTERYFTPQEIVVRLVYNLERTRVISLPEQVNPYIVSRAKYINTKL
jgi:hypothetical protein